MTLSIPLCGRTGPFVFKYLTLLALLVAPCVGAAQSVKSMTISPASIYGGKMATAKIKLSKAAPAAGLEIAITSDKTAAGVPSSVKAAAGSSSAQFTFKTTAVTKTVTATIEAAVNGSKATAPLEIKAPIMSGFTLSATTVPGGTQIDGEVTLSSPAPRGGVRVTFKVLHDSLARPSDFYVSEGSQSAIFVAGTKSVAATDANSITATAGDVSITRKLTILEPKIQIDPNLVPESVNPSTGHMVKLSSPAPSTGMIVNLVYDTKIFSGPTSVKLAKDKTQVGFSLLEKNGFTGPATISATYNNQVSTTKYTFVRPADDYFILGNGGVWTYKKANSSTASLAVTGSYGADEAGNFTYRYTWVTSDPTRNQWSGELDDWQRRLNGITISRIRERVVGQAQPLVHTFDAPLVLIPSYLADAYTWHQSTTLRGSDGSTEPFEVGGKVAYETITVQNKTYTNSLKITLTIDRGGFRSVTRSWYAATVGLIRRTHTADPNDRNGEPSSQYELLNKTYVDFKKAPWAGAFGDAANTGQGGSSLILGFKMWETKPLSDGTGVHTTSPVVSQTWTHAYAEDGNFHYYDINGKDLGGWSFNKHQARSTVKRDGTMYTVSDDFHLSGYLPSPFNWWQVDLPKSSSNVLSPPALAPDGTIYLVSGNLLCAYTSTGGTKWTYPVNDAVLSSTAPAIDVKGIVYVYDGLSRLHAIDSTGKEKWVFKPTFAAAHGGPAVVKSDGTVYYRYLGSDHTHRLTALDANGKQLWTKSFAIPASHTGVCGPSVAPNGYVYIQVDGIMYAFNSKGYLKWQVNTGPLDNDTSFAIGMDSAAFVRNRDGIYAIDSTGFVRWMMPDPSNGPAYLALGENGILYVADGVLKGIK